MHKPELATVCAVTYTGMHTWDVSLVTSTGELITGASIEPLITGTTFMYLNHAGSITFEACCPIAISYILGYSVLCDN